MPFTFGVEEQAVELPYIKLKGTVVGKGGEPYPKYKFHPTEAPQGQLVEDAEDEKSLGDGWFDSPAQFGVYTAPSREQMKEAERAERERKRGK